MNVENLPELTAEQNAEFEREVLDKELIEKEIYAEFPHLLYVRTGNEPPDTPEGDLPNPDTMDEYMKKYNEKWTKFIKQFIAEKGIV